MDISRTYFDEHNLSISVTKSKTMTYEANTGQTIFNGTAALDEMSLEEVIQFKYLGCIVSSSPWKLYRAHNDLMKAKARRYMYSVMSLTRRGPDRSALAHTLWTSVALPAILYCCEAVVVSQDTINEIARCQARVGRFIIQAPYGTANVASHIDGGLKPVWSIVAERTLSYALKVLDQPTDSWVNMAYQENLKLGALSSYTVYLNKWREKTNSFGVDIKQMKKNVHHAARQDVYSQLRSQCKTTFVMRPPKQKGWFKLKRWVGDSGATKLITEFRTCNVGLGNRRKTKDGRQFKLCQLCAEKGQSALNNEVKNRLQFESIK